MSDVAPQVPGRFDIGDDVTLRTIFYRLRDPGEPEDADAPDGYVNDDPGTVTITIQDPAGVQTTPSVTTPAGGAAGEREAHFVAAAAGRHYYRWSTTAPFHAADEGQFVVVASRLS